MSTSAYLITFFDEEGERIWGGRVHSLRCTDKGEIVSDPDYREVLIDPIYSGPAGSDGPFRRRAILNGPNMIETCQAISSDDFDTMEVEIVDHD